MRDVADTLARWSAAGEPFALATVVEVLRSAPRLPGAKMGISQAGEIVGSVSGGCVEGAVAQEAERVLAGAPPQLLRYGIADEHGWEVGLPCGGEIHVWVERFGDEPQLRFLDVARGAGRAALVTVLGPPEHAGERLVLDADGSESATIGSPPLLASARELAAAALWGDRPRRRSAGGADLFVDVTAPPPRLLIFGAGDVAQALARLACDIGWQVVVCDPRSRFATPERFPCAELVVAWPQEAVERIGGIDRATAVAVLTHDPKLDDAALSVALRSDAAYVGAMGSRRATEQRRRRLLELGLPIERVERLSAPIGLDIGGAEPAEAALSIVAELVAVRNGRQGGRLVASSARIHPLDG